MAWNKSLFFYLIFFLLFIPFLYAQELERADALIIEKKYDEALLILSNFAESNPEQSEQVQQRIFKINVLRDDFNITADELIDALLYDPGNNDKIRSLSSRLFTLENENSSLFSEFMDKTSNIPELNSNRNLIRDVLIKGQSLQEGGYFINYSDNTAFIIQRLIWDIDINVMQYEVVIINNDSNKESFRKKTSDNFIEISLQPGSYRYNITPFDFLGFQGDSSEWIEIEILHAYQPKITNFHPKEFYMDQRFERVINISGINFSEESRFYLSNGLNELHPIDVIIYSDTSVRLVFDDLKLITGTYDIYIINPGGISTKAGKFVIKYRKALDGFAKLTFTPLVPLYGEIYDHYGNKIFFSGITAAVEFISSKRSSFNGGLEVSASFFHINNIFTLPSNWDNLINYSSVENYNVAFNEINLNISFQKRFLQGLISLTFRFGCGISLFYGLEENTKMTFNINACLSGLFLLYEIFHIELGLDFSHYFLSKSTGFIKPKIGFVWKF